MFVLLPFKFLKWFNVVMAAMSIIAGIVLASVGGANASNEPLEIYDLYSLIMNSYVAFGIIYIVVGIIGLVGALKPHTGVTIAFAALLAVASIAFLGVGTAILAGWESEKTDFEDQGCGVSTYESYETAVTDGADLLCSSECPCDAPTWLFQSGITSSLNDGNTKTQDCDDYSDLSSATRSTVSYLAALEDEYNCTGFCTHPGYKLWTKISEEPESSPCLQFVLNDMEEISKDYGYGSIIVGLTFVLSSSLACCLVGALKRFDYKTPQA